MQRVLGERGIGIEVVERLAVAGADHQGTVVTEHACQLVEHRLPTDGFEEGHHVAGADDRIEARIDAGQSQIDGREVIDDSTRAEGVRFGGR